MATRKEISDFLAGVERRAYKHAVYTVRDEQFALEAVQEAMSRLVEKYAARPAAELPMLFQRILQNAIRDHFRRQKVRMLWTPQASSLVADEEEDRDALDILSTSAAAEAPDASDAVEQTQTLEIIEEALAELPARQRQAFLLRYWEDMDVAETAAVMGCSEGSVKTHCSRATHALAKILEQKGLKAS